MSLPWPNAKSRERWYSRHSFMGLKYGLYTRQRSKSYMPTWWDSWEPLWASNGMTRSPMMKSQAVHTYHGWRTSLLRKTMCKGWRMTGFLDSCCTHNYAKEKETKDDRDSDSRMWWKETWGIDRSTGNPGRPWQATELHGDPLSNQNHEIVLVESTDYDIETYIW